ncbi:hypothetical protein FKW77_006145 [Venturia effusa]|uniref:Uncharacterized protein n=1 Tax=Venturia effusa TaxID=50376 RepID=A0A517LAZ1_9PEZI|nr:hypothetical protein FKW77_006145 [Venturia effusa]
MSRSARSPSDMAASSSLSLLLLLATAINAQNTDASTDSNTATTTSGAASVSITAPNLSTVTDTPGATDSGTSTTAPTTSVTNAPTLSSSTNSIFHLSDVPTIAGYGIPTPVVPWTAGAPYMQRSDFPEGTVFIVVGAILGFMGAAVILWRGLVAWSLHRSVRKAAMTSHRNDSMLKLSKPNAFGGGAYGASNMSLERLSAPAGRASKHVRVHSSSNAAGRPSSSLFFSPTAGAGNHSSPTAALLGGNNKSSTFLPAGYYAAPGTGSPGGVPGSAPSPLSSLNPLHPSRAGYARQQDHTPSPPGSPGLRPCSPGGGALPRSRGYAGGYERSSGYGRPSTETGMYSQGASNLSNLHVPGGAMNGGRAPSANLEDMFEAHGNISRERL